MSIANLGLSAVVLRKLPLFAEVDEAELEKLAKGAVRKQLVRGGFAFRAGDETDSLHILLAGRAKVTNTDAAGREIILSWIGAGDFFGEMGLLDGAPRSANVMATERCDLLVIRKDSFMDCMQRNFTVARQLMLILANRLREANRKIESLALLDVYGRVAQLLNELAEDEGGRRVIKKKITKQDMAKMIGASREMVSKVMRDLELSGYIIYENERVFVMGA